MKEISIDGHDYYLIPKADRHYNRSKVIRIVTVEPTYALNSSILRLGLQLEGQDSAPYQKFNANDRVQILNLTKGDI